MSKIITLLLIVYSLANSHILGVHPPQAIFDLFEKDNKYQMIVLVDNAQKNKYLPTQIFLKQELKKTLSISINKKHIIWNIKKIIQEKKYTKIFISLSQKNKIKNVKSLNLKISFLNTKIKNVKNLVRIFLKNKTRQFVLNNNITTISIK